MASGSWQSAECPARRTIPAPPSERDHLSALTVADELEPLDEVDAAFRSVSERDDAMEAVADMTELSIEPFANAAR
jgi:hypothetical protein